MDETLNILMQMVIARVHDADNHRIDKKKLLGQIENLVSGIDGIEEIAMDVENGHYELPEDDRKRGEF